MSLGACSKRLLLHHSLQSIWSRTKDIKLESKELLAVLGFSSKKALPRSEKLTVNVWKEMTGYVNMVNAFYSCPMLVQRHEFTSCSFYLLSLNILSLFLYHHTGCFWHCRYQQYVGRLSHVSLVNGLSRHKSSCGTKPKLRVLFSRHFAVNFSLTEVLW